jgi:hypothetical protein
LTQLQLDVLEKVLIHEERQGAALEFSETFLLGAKDIPPRPEKGNLITAVVVCGDAARKAVVFFRDCHQGARYDRPRGIHYGPCKATLKGLPPGYQAADPEEKDQAL